MTDAATLAGEPAGVRAFWEELGLPGLFDVHVHFLPPNIQRAVYAVFDSAGPKIGRPWPIRYRQSHEARVELLRAMGVRRFPTLPYAHKPGVASYLNEWAAGFARDVPESLWSATFFPEPDAAAYVGAAIDDGVAIFKVHLQVGEFHLDDPLLDEVWGRLEDAGTPVVVHAGSGPVGNDFTGPASTERLLRRFPGSPSSSRTWAHRSAGSSSSWPSGTSGCTWTPRWSSPTSSRRTRVGSCRGCAT